MKKITSSQHKLLKLAHSLHGYYEERKYNYEKEMRELDPDFKLDESMISAKISRYELRQHIMKILGITDPHTVNNWVMKLLGKELILQNPHTHKTRRGYIKPSNDTKYYINIDQIKELIWTKTEQTTLQAPLLTTEE